MAIAKFLPTWMGGEADRVDGGGVMLSVPGNAAAEETYTVSSGAPVTTAIQTPPCGWCNGHHSGRCPLVKAIEYHPNGLVKRVEFISDERKPTDE